MKKHLTKIIFLGLVIGLTGVSNAQTQQKIPSFDYNQNSKQGENPAVHNTTPPATPTPKEYPIHPQDTQVGGKIIKGGAEVHVTIPVDKPKGNGALPAK